MGENGTGEDVRQQGIAGRAVGRAAAVTRSRVLLRRMGKVTDATSALDIIEQARSSGDEELAADLTLMASERIPEDHALATAAYEVISRRARHLSALRTQVAWRLFDLADDDAGRDAAVEMLERAHEREQAARMRLRLADLDPADPARAVQALAVADLAGAAGRKRIGELLDRVLDTDWSADAEAARAVAVAVRHVTGRQRLRRVIRVLAQRDAPLTGDARRAFRSSLNHNPALRRMVHDGLLDPDPSASLAVYDCIGMDVDRPVAGALRGLQQRGELSRMVGLWEAWDRRSPAAATWRSRRDTAAELLRLGGEGYPFPPTAAGPGYRPRERSVLMPLAMSLPWSSVGYATRSHVILTSLLADGYEPTAVTRPQFPYATLPAGEWSEVPDIDIIDSVEYRRLPPRSTATASAGELGVVEGIEQHAERLMSLARDHRVSVIHSASDYRNGLAGITAARRLGLPSIYEVRGLWYLTRATEVEGYADSEGYRVYESLEVQTCSAADAVLVLTEALRDELVGLGVPRERTHLFPNGVDVDRFAPRPRDEDLAAALDLQGKTVIGFIGTQVAYEGLDTLLHGMRILADRRADVHCLLVGDGAETDNLRALADELRLDGVVTFTGRVPHDQVQRYYSLVDVVVLPRAPYKVCEIVAPLKPFEAMASQKAVVVSSVAALREIVIDGETGLVFEKGDPQSLADVLDRVTGDPGLRADIAEAGRQWVARERDWRVIIKRLEHVYRDLQG